MALRWSRVKLGPFESYMEWEQAIRSLAEVVGKLEGSADLVRYYFFNHGAPAPEIMMNLCGDPQKLLAELESAGLRRWIMPNMPEDFKPTDEMYRFGDDYMIGIALCELGSRLAIANRQRRPLLETNKGVTQSIFLVMRHAFSSGMLSMDQRFMALLDPPLEYLHEFFTAPYGTRLSPYRPPE